MYDSIIIGTGPAGLSAALNLKIHKKEFLWFGSELLSDKVRKAEKISNYPGFPEASGEDLFRAFDNHRKAAGLTITEKTVTMIGAAGDHYMVLADNEMFETRTLILCMGVLNAKLLEGEDRFLGRGLSYCATCDGMLYKGKKIAVLCNDPKYEHEVEYLADLAEQVTYFPTFGNSTVNRENVTISKDMPVALNGEMKVSGLTLKSGEELPVDGLFALRNAIAPSTLMPGLKIDNGHIVTDKDMATSFEGCYAAGDCTGRPYQYTKAVGEGNIAAHSVIKYLAVHKDA